MVPVNTASAGAGTAQPAGTTINGPIAGASVEAVGSAAGTVVSGAAGSGPGSVPANADGAGARAGARASAAAARPRHAESIRRIAPTLLTTAGQRVAGHTGAMGFDSTRPKVVKRGDYVVMVAATVVTIGLLVWAFLG